MYFLLYFQKGKDSIASLSDCKYQLQYLLIRGTARYILDKEITNADVWQEQEKVIIDDKLRHQDYALEHDRRQCRRNISKESRE